MGSGERRKEVSRRLQEVYWERHKGSEKSWYDTK